MKKSTSSSAHILFLFFLLLLCLLLLLISASSAQKPKCHPKDQKAMEQIAASFGINFTGDCCDAVFVRVFCTFIPPYNHVTVFKGDNNSNISGSISSAIGDLSYLEILEFNNVRNLTGIIPPTISKLSKLYSIFISFTNISGPIPTFHENLTKIIDLDLSNNAFTGSIPSELPIWFPNLQYLSLNNNKLKGTIPESMGNLPWSSNDFRILILSDNLLTGPIPKSLGILDPYYLDLSGNKFYGNASALFGENKKTVNLRLYGNNFSFDLSKVHFWPNLSELNVSHNKIFGSLPQAMTHLTALSSLDVSHNKIFGSLPQELTQLTALRILDVSHNKLYGDASVLFGKNKATASLRLDGNNFNFNLSKVHFSREFYELNLSNNNIYGSLPQEMKQLYDLMVLDVSHNKLCGEIPQGGQLQNFSSSSYSHNKCLCGAPLPPCVKDVVSLP